MLDEQGKPVADPAFQESPRPNSAFGNHEAMRADNTPRS